VRPVGLVYSPTRNRYRYSVPAASPSTTAWTLWPYLGSAVVTSETTIVSKVSSVATSQTTGTSSSGMPPPVAGPGARRVHNTRLVTSGSPEATPSVKGGPGSGGTGGVGVVPGSLVLVLVAAAASPSLSSEHAARAATPAAPMRNSRRLMDIGRNLTSPGWPRGHVGMA
jgi:hypothetical protein